MTPVDLYLAFVAASTVLILIPGPNVSLIVANSIAYGTRYGLLTVAGTSAAIVVQLGLTALGMTAVLGTLAGWFEWLRWVGVAYLLYLGIRQWRAEPVDLTRTRPQPRSVRASSWQRSMVDSWPSWPGALESVSFVICVILSAAVWPCAAWRGGCAGRRGGGPGSGIRSHLQPTPAPHR